MASTAALLDEMIPSPATTGAGRGTLVDVEDLSNLSEGESLAPQSSHLYDYIVGKLGSWVTLSFGPTLSRPSLSLFHVFHIVDMGSYVKMLWIHAKRVVAFVQNKFLGWNQSSKVYLHRDAMRSSPLNRRIGSKYLPIASTILGTSPLPTFSQFRANNRPILIDL